MAVKTKKQVYEAHGKESETKEEAEKYDELRTARNAFETARSKFERLTAESQKTADGYAFSFGTFCDYYFVREYASRPSIERVSFYPWDLSLREDEVGVSIRDDGKERSSFYPIGQLYYREANAIKALTVAQELAIRNRIIEANMFRASVGMEPLAITVGGGADNGKREPGR